MIRLLRARPFLALAALCGAGLSAAAIERPGVVLEEYVFIDGPTRDCHASSLLELANGDLLCTWFGGTREGAPDVRIWLSRKPRSAAWTTPVAIGGGGGRTVFNPVLYQPRGGDITIAYCSPGIDTGEVITSKDDGHTWSEPRRLPAGFVGPIVNKPVQLPDGTIIAGASLQGHPGKRIHVERSTDNGATWTKIGPISDPVGTKYQIIQPTFWCIRRSVFRSLRAPTRPTPTPGSRKRGRRTAD